MRLRRWFSGLSRGGKAATIAAVLLVLYTVVGFLVVPAVVRSQAVKYLEETLSRRVAIEKVRFNPYALSLTIAGLEIGDRDGSDFLAWEEAHADLQLASIVEGGPAFREIRLTGPYVHVKILADGRLNVADIPEAFASAEQEEEQEEPDGEAIPFLAQLMLIEHGKFVFSDLSHTTPFRQELGPIDLELTDFATLPDRASSARFEAETEAGERFVWEGSLSVTPLSSQGTVTIAKLQPRSGWRYFQDNVTFEITDGALDVEVRYDASLVDGRPVLTIEDSGVSLEGFKLLASDNDEPIIEIPRLTIGGVALDLSSQRVDVASIELDGARLRGWIREDGRPHYTTLIAETVAGEEEEAADADESTDDDRPAEDTEVDAKDAQDAEGAADTDEAGEPWTFAIADVQITDLGLEFEDRSTPTPARFDLQPISLSARGITNEPDSAADIDLDLTINETGKLGATGRASMDPPWAELDVELEAIPLPAFAPYVAAAAPLELTAGSVSADASVAVRPETDGQPLVTMRGSISIDGLATSDAAGELLGWKRLAFAELAVDVEPTSLSIGRIDLVEARASLVVLEDGRTNFAALAGGPPAVADASDTDDADDTNGADGTPDAGAASAGGAADTPADDDDEDEADVATGDAALAPDAPAQPAPADGTAAAPSIPIEIKIIALEGVGLEITDRSIEPAFELSLSELSGTVSGLSSAAGARADVDLEARLARTGKVDIEGQITPLSEDAYTDLRIALANLDLGGFSPYTGRYVGRTVSGGRMTLNLEYKVSEDVLVGENNVEIDAFSFGGRVQSEDATTLPVGLAVALLKDASGRIDLDLPVRGDLSDPEFSLLRLIVGALTNLITKVAASPFNLVGRLVPGGGENLDFVMFRPGADAAAGDERDKLKALTKALDSRPALGLEIFGAAARDRDVAGLQQRRLETRLREMRFEDVAGKKNAPATADEVELDEKERAKLFEKLYRKTFDEKPKALLASLPEPPPDDEEAWLQERTERRLSETFTITDADLEELARERAQSIADELADAGIDSERLFVLDPRITETSEDGPRCDLALIGM